jgi:hypothetical protein
MLKTSHSEIKGKMSKFLLFHLSQISQNIFIYLQKESEEDPDEIVHKTRLICRLIMVGLLCNVWLLRNIRTVITIVDVGSIIRKGIYYVSPYLTLVQARQKVYDS